MREFPLSTRARAARAQPIGYLMAEGIGAPKGKIRLSFGPTSPEDIEKGVARLGAVLSRFARKRKR